MNGDRAIGSIHFSPGKWTAAVGPTIAAVIDCRPEDDRLQRLLADNTPNNPPSVILTDWLTGSNAVALPDFAIVALVGDRLHAFARGAGQVIGRRTDGTSQLEVNGTGLLTWREQAIAGIDELVIGLTDLDPSAVSAYRAGSGLVPARQLVINVAASEPEHLPDDSNASPGTSSALPANVVQSQGITAPSPDAVTSTPVDVEDGAGGFRLAASDADPSNLPDASPAPPSDAVNPNDGADQPTGTPDNAPPMDARLVDTGATITEVPGISVPDEGSVGPPANVEDSVSYDELFGSTQMRSVEGAAVRADVPAEEPQGGTGRASLNPQGEENPDHDGHTITVDQLQQLRATSNNPAPTPPATSSADGPKIPAVMCPALHPNAPHEATCRACGELISPQDPIKVPRPSLGNLVFAHGVTVPLDVNVFIGRSPRLSGQLPGGITPKLVEVPSPNRDVSRTHLEVRLEGWQVLVIDRNSANGTIVEIDGRKPQQLRPGEPFLLPVGGRVVLADEASFRLEADT